MVYDKKLLLLVVFLFCSLLSYGPPIPLEVSVEGKYRLECFEVTKLQTENKLAIDALGMYESTMNFHSTNSIGAMGCWQFMPETLKYFGYGHITTKRFKRNPNIFDKDLQKKLILMKINDDIKALTAQWWRSDSLDVNYIERYVGKEICGVKVTLFGLLAASHIAGSYGTIRFLEDNKNNPKDINGKGPLSYIKMFSKYNYTDESHLNKRLQCAQIKRNLTLSNVCSRPKLRSRLKMISEDSCQKDTVTVMISDQQKPSPFLTVFHQKPYLSNLEYRCTSHSITGRFSMREVQHVSSTRFGSGTVQVKSKPIIQVFGMHFSWQLGTRRR